MAGDFNIPMNLWIFWAFAGALVTMVIIPIWAACRVIDNVARWSYVRNVGSKYRS